MIEVHVLQLFVGFLITLTVGVTLGMWFEYRILGRLVKCELAVCKAEVNEH